MIPVNETVVELLQKRAQHYRNQAQEERYRFGYLTREMTDAVKAIQSNEDRAKEFDEAAKKLMEAAK